MQIYISAIQQENQSSVDFRSKSLFKKDDYYKSAVCIQTAYSARKYANMINS